jgi:hypothetical protein
MHCMLCYYAASQMVRAAYPGQLLQRVLLLEMMLKTKCDKYTTNGRHRKQSNSKERELTRLAHTETVIDR